MTVGGILVVTSYKPHDHDLAVELHKATGQKEDLLMPVTLTCLEV